MLGKDEDMTEMPVNFTITGYYKNPLINISNIYDEIYTSPEFIEQYNPVMKEQIQPIYVKLNNLNPLLLKTDVMSKLQEASELAVFRYPLVWHDEDNRNYRKAIESDLDAANPPSGGDWHFDRYRFGISGR